MLLPRFRAARAALMGTSNTIRIHCQGSHPSKSLQHVAPRPHGGVRWHKQDPAQPFVCTTRSRLSNTKHSNTRRLQHVMPGQNFQFRGTNNGGLGIGPTSQDCDPKVACTASESSNSRAAPLLCSVHVIHGFPEAAGQTDMADNTSHATSVPCARLMSHHSNTSCQPVTGTACCITFMKTILAHWQHHSHESHPTHCC